MFSEPDQCQWGYLWFMQIALQVLKSCGPKVIVVFRYRLLGQKIVHTGFWIIFASCPRTGFYCLSGTWNLLPYHTELRNECR